MRIARFRKNEYEYFYLLNEETTEVKVKRIEGYKALFDYVNFDLSKLEKALETYVLKKLDINRPAVKDDYTYSKSDLDDIKKEMSALHPLFEDAGEADLLQYAIADSLNGLLVQAGAYAKMDERIQQCINEGILSKESAVGMHREWYFLILEEISPPLMCEELESIFGFSCEQEKGNFLQSHFEEFLDRSPALRPIPHPFLATGLIKQHEPALDLGFMADLKKDQTVIREMLRLLLDADGPFKKASPPQRCRVFSEYFNKEHKREWMSVKECFKFYGPLLDEVESDGVLPSNYAETVAKSNTLTPEICTAFKQAEEAAIKAVKGEIFREYEINDLHQLLFLEILQMINQRPRFKLRRCNECGRFYSPASLKTKYCTEACVKAAKRHSQRKYAESAANEPTVLYRRAQLTLLKFLERCKNKGIIDQNTEKEKRGKWREAAGKELAKAINGDITAEVFELWLKDEQARLKKELSATRQRVEEFYGKDFETVLKEHPYEFAEMDWGKPVGKEVW